MMGTRHDATKQAKMSESPTGIDDLSNASSHRESLYVSLAKIQVLRIKCERYGPACRLF